MAIQQLEYTILGREGDERNTRGARPLWNRRCRGSDSSTLQKANGSSICGAVSPALPDRSSPPSERTVRDRAPVCDHALMTLLRPPLGLLPALPHALSVGDEA